MTTKQRAGCWKLAKIRASEKSKGGSWELRRKSKQEKSLGRNKKKISEKGPLGVFEGQIVSEGRGEGNAKMLET